MKKSELKGESMNLKKLSTYFCATFALLLMAATAAAQQASVPLGTAASYAVLAGSTITNTGATTINGDLGLSPGTAVTGFPPGTVIGTIRTAAAAAPAQTDLITAYNDAAGRIPVTTVATELGGQTLVAGVYNSAAGTLGITGILTLDGQNNANAVFIFKAASTLTTAAGAPGTPASQVVLIRGAQPCNVFWQVGSSATLGTYSVFQGSILALTSITVTTGATVNGRVLARNGAVTLDSNTITAQVCAAATAPDLTISKTHLGNFTQGQTGATYTLTANNIGAAPTSGTVTVSDTLPVGLTATAISGTGWSCVLGTLTCTRTDALAAGASYPVITVTVSVASNAAASLINMATVAGGGELNTSNNSASDVTPIIPVVVPPVVADLIILKTHLGNFTQAQTGATYTLTANNVGAAPTSGAVTVSDTLPVGLTATAISGPGWSCALLPLACTRSDALAAGASYPVITVTVSVASNGLAFNPVAGSPAFQAGDILISMADGTVQWRRRDWTLAKVLTSGTDGQAKGMAFDSSGNLFVTHWTGFGSSGNNIERFDRSGNFTGFFGTGFDCNPSSIALDNSGNTYVGHADCSAQIFKFDSSGNRLAQYNVGVENRGSYHIGLDPNQCTMYYTSNGPNVKRFNVCSNTQMSNFNSAPLPDPIGGAQEFSLLPGGGMLVANFGVIARLNASGNLVATYKTLAGNQCWLGSELDPDGTSFWASNWCGSSVTRFDIATSNVIESHVADDRGFQVKQIAIPGNIFSIVVTNTATVAGGGELNTSNNSASDATTINPPAQPPPASNSPSIVNAARYAPTVAAGSIASAFGSNLSIGTESSAGANPLPFTLASSSFQIGGQAVPLFYASPSQVNLQIPWELAGQTQASVTATVGGVASNQQTMSLAPFAPGIFTLNGAGTGQGAVLIRGTAQLAAPLSVPGSRPARPGEFIEIYGTGLGAVSNQPTTGAAAQASPLSLTSTTPTVTIGGVFAQVSFSGLAPGAVGLYQVNVQVPGGAPAGDAVPVVISIGDATSNAVTIAVQ